jgi:hypothetical protein
MDYKQFLEVVKKQNPEKKFREQQKMASEMLKKFQASKESFKSSTIESSVPGVHNPEKELPMSALAAAEKRLRSNVIDINSLRTVGKEVMPEGIVVQHGKDGVNTKVTFEDSHGNRLPQVGYFRIYI